MKKCRFRPLRWTIRLLVLLLVLNALRLTVWMPGHGYAGPAAQPTPDRLALGAELRRDVAALAREPHSFVTPAGLERAAAEVEQALRRTGAKVSVQEYRVPAGALGTNWNNTGYDARTFRNFIAEIPGTDRPGEVVVVGAHYDSVAIDRCRGANDNATGVAALLALARRAAAAPAARTIRLVAFVNEEPPFFQTEHMGSYVYAKSCRDRGDRIVAMVSFDSLGYYSDAPDSQYYPIPALAKLYPDRANYLGFIGNLNSTPLVRRCVDAFRARTPFPSQGAALPDRLPGIADSDQWAFWQFGYPAVMVTDTAHCRDPYYHTDRDNPERLDYDRLAVVVEGLGDVLNQLAK